MFINSVQNISFKGIIDTHVHTGHWYKQGESGYYYGKNFTDNFKAPLRNTSGTSEADTFTRNTDRVDNMLVSDLDVMSEEYYRGEFFGNEDFLKTLEEDPFYVPLAVCRPDKTNGDTKDIEKLLEKYPKSFAGFKFHPEAMNLPADDCRYEPYMKLAQEKNFPCMFHSEGEGVSGVRAIYNLAKKFPNVPVILAHMGAGGAFCHQKAIDVFEESLKNDNANLYVDLSWVDWENGLPSFEKPSVKKVIDVALQYDALDHILFATDTPLGCFGENPEGGKSPLEAYELSVETLQNFIKRNYPENYNEILNGIFHDNAAKLFDI